MSALKQLLCGDMKKHIDLMEQDLRTYADMRHAVMTWVINKGLEKGTEHAKDPMDRSNVNGGGRKTVPACGEAHWPDDAGWMQGYVNYVKCGGQNYGKSFGGKGYGKSFGRPKGGDMWNKGGEE